MVNEGARRCLFIGVIMFQVGVVVLTIISNCNYCWEAQLDNEAFEKLAALFRKENESSNPKPPSPAPSSPASPNLVGTASAETTPTTTSTTTTTLTTAVVTTAESQQQKKKREAAPVTEPSHQQNDSTITNQTSHNNQTDESAQSEDVNSYRAVSHSDSNETTDASSEGSRTGTVHENQEGHKNGPVPSIFHPDNDPLFKGSSTNLHYVRGGLWNTCLYPHSPTAKCEKVTEEFVESGNGLNESWVALQVLQALVIAGCIFSILLLLLIFFNICKNMFAPSVAAAIISIFQVAVILSVTIMMAIIFQSNKSAGVQRSWGSITYLQWLNNGLAITVAGFVVYAVACGPTNRYPKDKDEKVKTGKAQQTKTPVAAPK